MTIDPANGDFRGRAWSENKGWITFAFEGAHPYKMKTVWSCDPAPPPPPGSPKLMLNKSGTTALLLWNELAGASGTYDSGGPGQVGGRDAGIAASAQDCP